MRDRGEAGAAARAIYRLSHALGQPLSVIEAMPVEEVRGHLAYLDFLDEARSGRKRR